MDPAARPPTGGPRQRAHPRAVNPAGADLIRDTYRAGDDVSELFNGTWQGTGVDLEQHLIARMLRDAYTSRSGSPEPRLPQATQVLAFLARQINHDHTRDLGWWHIPRWASTTPRILVSMITVELLGGIVGTILLGLIYVALVVVYVLRGGSRRASERGSGTSSCLH